MNCLFHEMSKSVKNSHLYFYFAEPSVMSRNSFCCPNGPKHKDFAFLIISDTEKQQILTFERLNQQLLLRFYQKNY